MKLILALLLSLPAFADTPPPNSVKAKLYDGTGAQAIGNVSDSIKTSVTNSSLPVTGTFWQSVQPVSVSSLPALSAGSAVIGHVAVDSAPTTAVTGTFWQATQPVSGTLTCNAGTGTLAVDASGHTVPVSGTFWQSTQPMSAASLPLPTGAATAAKQPALGTAGSASSDVLSVQGIASMTALKVDGSAVTQPVSGTFWQATQPVSGTFWQSTQPVSAASLPLPTGAATAAKQPALGTAGSASSDVISVQGVASMTALKVDASGTTVPVSGTFWQTTQPVSIATMPSTPVTGTFWQTTQPVSVASLPALAAGTNVIGHVIVDTAPTTAVTQSGTWTFQPGNSANTTAWLVTQGGRAKANAPVRNAYASTNVTTGAWVQLVASTTSATSMVCIFDSSGQTLQLGTGAASSEVAQMTVFPGGNGCEPLSIAASTRVSVEALSATASTGEIDINFYQ